MSHFIHVCILSSVCVIFYIQNKKSCYSLKNNSLSYYINFLNLTIDIQNVINEPLYEIF